MKNKLLTVWAFCFIFSLLNCDSKKEASVDTPKAVSNEKINMHVVSKEELQGLSLKNLEPKLRVQSFDTQDQVFDSFDFLGEKIIFAFFTYKHKAAAHMLSALQQLMPFQAQYQFRVVGVSLDLGDRVGLERFLKEKNIILPVIFDSAEGDLARKFKVTQPIVLRSFGNDHAPSFALQRYVFDEMSDGQEQFLNLIKSELGVKTFHGTLPILGNTPLAPQFKGKLLDGKPFSLSQLKGKAVLLLFYLPTCPHCQKEIAYLKEKIYPTYSKQGLEIVAVSVRPLEGEMLEVTKKLAMPWLIMSDQDREIREQFSKEMAVPESFMIDREGRIRFHSGGFGNSQHAGLIELQIRKIMGLPNTTEVLSGKHFNGAQTCAVCHEAEYVQWQTTAHGNAFETLQNKGEENDPECVSCHTLGFEQEGGYKVVTDEKSGKKIALVPEHLQNVSCENCHGMGGPHRSAPKTAPEMQQTCLSCHTEKFSLHFDYGERVKKVDHSNKNEIMKMDIQDRLKLLEKVSKSSAQLFGSDTKYVGSNACMTCHQDQHSSWKTSVHAAAFQTLVQKGKDKDETCLKCHTTGYGQTGGFHESMAEDLKGVGCESCHGPGGVHIESTLKKDIRGLGEDCPFCVIEQICLSCHDTKNDPDFNINKALKDAKGHGPKKQK